MILPYWNTDLDLEIASWFPLGLDYHPVLPCQFENPQINRIASRCLAFDSEFLFMSSLRLGCVGSLMRDSFYKDDLGAPPLLGFMMILGYSPEMERLIIDTLTDPMPDFEPADSTPDSDKSNTDSTLEVPFMSSLSAGVAFCSLWTRRYHFGDAKNNEFDAEPEGEIESENGTLQNRGRGHRFNFLMGSMKVIALVSENIFFDESNFLDHFETRLEANLDSRAHIPFFAEKFGYRRFSMPYDTDDPTQLQISRILYEIEFAETRHVVGPSPEVPFPPLIVMR